MHVSQAPVRQHNMNGQGGYFIITGKITAQWHCSETPLDSYPCFYQRRIQDRPSGMHLLCFGNVLGFVFVNFDCITCIYFNFSVQYDFFLYSNYKSIEYVLRGIKTIPRPQELYCARTAPPVLIFLDLPLSMI